MKIVIAGGHGRIALRLTRLLAGRGDTVVGIVRNPRHLDDVGRAGGAGRIYVVVGGTTPIGQALDA